jgi:putative transposase
MVDRWTGQGYSISLVCDFVGLAPFTYYAVKARRNQDEPSGKIKANRGGRPRSNCCLTREGKAVPDEQVKEWLGELISGDGFPYGYSSRNTAQEEGKET